MDEKAERRQFGQWRKRKDESEVVAGTMRGKWNGGTDVAAEAVAATGGSGGKVAAKAELTGRM